jgi:hypothetical protein
LDKLPQRGGNGAIKKRRSLSRPERLSQQIQHQRRRSGRRGRLVANRVVDYTQCVVAETAAQKDRIDPRFERFRRLLCRVQRRARRRGGKYRGAHGRAISAQGGLRD